MYHSYSNSQVDSEVIVEISDGRRFRVHQTGYVEGDTNGFVEGDFEIFPMDGEDWYEQLSDFEGKQFIDSELPIERRLVFLDGELGEKAVQSYCLNNRKSHFEYDGKLWRVFNLRHPNPVWKGNNSVGKYVNGAECLVTLVPFGSVTLFEAICDIADNSDWESCDCQSSWYEDY